jgi:hypothetical protein
VQKSDARVRKAMILKRLFFAVFALEREERGSGMDSQYYTAVSIPQKRKKSRKIGDRDENRDENSR